jgi:hypothetical protein
VFATKEEKRPAGVREAHHDRAESQRDFRHRRDREAKISPRRHGGTEKNDPVIGKSKILLLIAHPTLDQSNHRGPAGRFSVKYRVSK